VPLDSYFQGYLKPSDLFNAGPYCAVL